MLFPVDCRIHHYGRCLSFFFFLCISLLICEITSFTTFSSSSSSSSSSSTTSFFVSQRTRKNNNFRLYSTKKKTTNKKQQQQQQERTISNLMEWAKENEIQVGGVKVSDDNTVGGLGLVSTRDLKKDDIMIQVPTSMIIQSSNDVDSDVVVQRQVYQDAAWWAQLSLQLHLLKTSSSSSSNDDENKNYGPWLESLPQQMNTPIHWNDDMLNEMQYSHMIQSVEAQRTLWKDQYQTIVSSTDNNHQLSLSYDDFVWGCEMARSRAFSGSYSGSAFNPAPFIFTLLFMTVYLGLNIGTFDQAANGAGVVLCGIVFKDFIFPKLFKNSSNNKKNYVICPVIDMANHQSYSVHKNVVAFEYFANAYSLSTTVEDGSLSKDKELFISYGPRSNDQLFQYYGFVEVDNPHDVYIMPPLRQWDIAALEEACGRTFSSGRLQKLDKAGLLGIEESKKLDLEAENRGGGVVLSRTEGLDPAVLTALRVLVSSDEEWMTAGEAIGNFVTDNSGGTTNEQLARLAAVTALQQELDSKPTTLEDDIQLLRQMKQMNTLLDDDDSEQTQLALEFRIEKKKILKETIQSLQSSYSSA